MSIFNSYVSVYVLFLPIYFGETNETKGKDQHFFSRETSQMTKRASFI